MENETEILGKIEMNYYRGTNFGLLRFNRSNARVLYLFFLIQGETWMLMPCYSRVKKLHHYFNFKVVNCEEEQVEFKKFEAPSPKYRINILRTIRPIDNLLKG